MLTLHKSHSGVSYKLLTLSKEYEGKRLLGPGKNDPIDSLSQNSGLAKTMDLPGAVKLWKLKASKPYSLSIGPTRNVVAEAGCFQCPWNLPSCIVPEIGNPAFMMRPAEKIKLARDR